VIEVLSNGALNLVQDLGRREFLNIGVSSGGAMDPQALQLANAMVGNQPAAAGIEVSIFPFRVKFFQNTYFACTGSIGTLKLNDRQHAGWWTAFAQAGDVLSIAPPVHGARAYLAFAGGIEVPLVLGSRSTDLKSGFGGHLGRGLRKGDILNLRRHNQTPKRRLASYGIAQPSRIEFLRNSSTAPATIRVIANAEFDDFTKESIKLFETSGYRLTPDCNRQGFRLEGAVLKRVRSQDLLSHGIVPGTIQVPPSGQPIIQMAEANTCGGYPKIGTVIEPDLWRVAQSRPGQSLKFTFVDFDQGLEVAQKIQDEMQSLQNSISLMT
jgi:biotin-dependent carboxylase-like uncharacterized protein